MEMDFIKINDRIIQSTRTRPLPPRMNNLDKTSGAFVNYLEDSINQVADLQKESKQMTQGFLMGKVENLHDVTIASERAGLAMKTLNTLRKKILEVYKDVSSTRL
jgi:flagellar hook-basal body complex protein FliE